MKCAAASALTPVYFLSLFSMQLLVHPLRPFHAAAELAGGRHLIE